MSKGVILIIAAVCGVAAFVWTLAARSPGRDRPVVFRQSAPFSARGAHPGAMAAPPPRTLEGLERYVKEQPGDFQGWFDLAGRRHAANLPEESAAWAMVVKTAGEETLRNADWGLAWYQLGWASEKLGDADRAHAAFANAERIYTRYVTTTASDNIGVLTRLGWARLKLGDQTGARDIWERGQAQLTRIDARDLDADSAYNLACFRSLLGRPADALDALAIAVEHGYTDADWATTDDDLTPIGHDPRFAELVQKMRGAPKPMQWQDGGVATPAK